MAKPDIAREAPAGSPNDPVDRRHTLARAPLAVTLDARMAFHSGIGRYIRGLGRALQRADPGPTLTLLAPKADPRFEALLPGARHVAYEAGIYTLREQIEGSWVCRRRRSRAGGDSVFHFPHYNTPWWLPPNSVVTIHDLTHLDFPQFFSKSRVRLARIALARVLRHADRVIAVSEATRDAIDRSFPGAAARIEVVHHGVDSVFRPPADGAAEALRLREGLGPFFLYVGNDKPHKNLKRLKRAFDQLQARRPDVSLVFISPAPVGRYGSTRIVEPPSDAELAGWYGASEALVLPSLNEGFGMTALEAAACGTPVIASDIAALREITGGAAVLVEPDDEAAWVAAMARILDEPEARAALRRKGLERAASFTWDAAARKTLEIYRAVAGPPS